MADLVDDLEAEGSPLSLRAVRYIRIKRQTEEQMAREKRRLAELLYQRGYTKEPPATRRLTASEAHSFAKALANSPRRVAAEPGAGQAPIAKITVRESGAGHYAPDDISVSLYAPGLPPGEHDVYCEPMSVAPALKSGVAT
jgi:hypothetical protein